MVSLNETYQVFHAWLVTPNIGFPVFPLTCPLTETGMIKVGEG